jgi:hypothetical protein
MDAMTVDSWGGATQMTSATAGLTVKDDGTYGCPKHPEQTFASRHDACELCEHEFQQNRAALQERRASVEEQLRELRDDGDVLQELQRSLQAWKPATEDGPVNAPLPPQSANGNNNNNSNNNEHGNGANPPLPPRYPPSGNTPSPTSGGTNLYAPSGPAPPHTLGGNGGLMSSMYNGMPSMMSSPPNHPFDSGNSNSQTNPAPMDALAMQIQGMQRMQDWMLWQKEQECQALRQKVETSVHEANSLRVENALLQEKLHQQEQRMQHELKLIKLAALNTRREKTELPHKATGPPPQSFASSSPESLPRSKTQQQSFEPNKLSKSSTTTTNAAAPVHVLLPKRPARIGRRDSTETAVTVEPSPEQNDSDQKAGGFAFTWPPVKSAFRDDIEFTPPPAPSEAKNKSSTPLQHNHKGYAPTPATSGNVASESPDANTGEGEKDAFTTNSIAWISTGSSPSVLKTTSSLSSSSSPKDKADTSADMSKDSPQRQELMSVSVQALAKSIQESNSLVTAGAPKPSGTNARPHPWKPKTATTEPTATATSDAKVAVVAATTAVAVAAKKDADVAIPKDINVDEGPPQVPLEETLTVGTLPQAATPKPPMYPPPFPNSSKNNSATGNATTANNIPNNNSSNNHQSSFPLPSGSQNRNVSFVDDSASVGMTVASSTYGEDRQKVVEQVIMDPYGDKGHYTGVILRSTGMPHGSGRMIYQEDKRTYDGEWRHGRWHGFGRATFANNDNYEGEYRFDQRHGRGCYNWSDGRIYDGLFREDKRHGQGKFTWPDGAVYDGEFRNGQREGHGVYKFSDGGRYEGSWKDGRYNGFGICNWEDGRTYKGEWLNGMAHGKGVETYANGSVRHDGQWIEDEPIT